MSPTGPTSAAAAAISSAAAHEYFKGELLTGTGDAYEIEALSEPQGQHLALFLPLTLYACPADQSLFLLYCITGSQLVSRLLILHQAVI